MARAHPISAIVEKLAREKGMIVGPGHPPLLGLALEPLLNPVPGLKVHDRRMKAIVDQSFVAQPSDIDRVGQDPVEMASRDRDAAGPSAGPAHSDRRANVLGVQSGLEADHAADFEVTEKETADELRLVFDHMESAVFDTVAERNRSAHPNALPL
jgi:hypothetical protein